ncbi:hypothetical protein KAFR_0J02910 [Kazachstania africana CBS 2517]|uniref:3',5'-cyclic-nucleotide phosphodiesterase n=1 Tax=Kazachstania africana (strain ATCC 22294 / BCRC 22015 / CBS 2517 / CECT 1963 / NBRC 1671 / NRRL Y-8276) TaxID=1071382 RepID=H2B155_KAZAF|nr:hypothetical protein KAFR_0J02910 [Kazachstania africana CBS 2517]CCF60355.1 hypothetical protein KAFR_0J02910 [Kazachstania africana CBS 2517]
MPSFEIVILGAVGGPYEQATQCFMLRPYGLEGTMESICIDGGAGINQIAWLLMQYKKQAINESVRENFFRESGEILLQDFIDTNIPHQYGFPNSLLSQLDLSLPVHVNAVLIYEGIKEFYITHPHLDHIGAMVLNSPLLFEPNPNSADPKQEKTLYSLPFTSKAIREHIFNDEIWPDLMLEGSEPLMIQDLKEEKAHKSKTFPNWKITAFPVHHGNRVTRPSAKIYSSAFVIQNEFNKDAIAIFGDVEQDELISKIWQHIVDNVPAGSLKAILIECSSPDNINPTNLYGHLSPKLLIHEIKCLSELYKSGLSGLDVIITHVKFSKFNLREDPRVTILNQIKKYAAMETALNGVNFSMTLEGISYIR